MLFRNLEDVMADNYIRITNQDFDEKVLKAPQMVVVAFLASWSDTCQILVPEFDAVGKEYQGRVTFATIDVDEDKAWTKEWNVDGVPTMIFFNQGKEIHRISGIMMRDKLRRQVEGVLIAL
jgi:thioredoxin 1